MSNGSLVGRPVSGGRLIGAVIAGAGAASWAEDWPHWRGPARNGTSAEKSLPLRWTTTESIAWKRPLPDRSGSTPIVSGRRIFLNVAEGDAIALWALDHPETTLERVADHLMAVLWPVVRELPKRAIL